jgi:hypothetical protein
VLLILLVFAALFLFDQIGRVIADGALPFEIQLHQRIDRPISRVSYATLFGDERAIPALRVEISMHKDEYASFRPVNAFDQNRFTVHIPFSRHITGLGRTREYWPYRLLALKIEFDGGDVEYCIVPIPDGRECRPIDVHLPPEINRP